MRPQLASLIARAAGAGDSSSVTRFPALFSEASRAAAASDFSWHLCDSRKSVSLGAVLENKDSSSVSKASRAAAGLNLRRRFSSVAVGDRRDFSPGIFRASGEAAGWQSRSFASVAAVDKNDDRPPSMRKVGLKEEEVVLRGFPRKKTGKIWCKKERRVGLVPGIVFGQEDGHLGGNKNVISVEKQQLETVVNKIGRSFFLSRTYDLEIYDQPGGELHSKEKVLPRTIHIHATSDQVLNVTFIRAPPHSQLKVEVPLVFLGEDSCPGIRKGGYVNTIMRKVQFRCPGDAIPPFLEVDISSMDVGQKVLLKDIRVDPRLKLVHKDSTLPVLKIMGTRSVVEAAASK